MKTLTIDCCDNCPFIEFSFGNVSVVCYCQFGSKIEDIDQIAPHCPFRKDPMLNVYLTSKP